MSIPKILVVDDEKDIRQLFIKTLSIKFEGEFIEAANGYEAIEILQKGGMDLMLLDIKMPGISGREVIHKAREISSSIIIVVITRYDSPELSKELEQMRVDYMPKPPSVKLLRDKIEQKLDSVGKLILKQIV